MTEDDILAELLAREGGYRPEVERPNGTVDPETMYGITWPTFVAYCRLVGVVATRAGHLALSKDTARAIYTRLFIVGPGFTPEYIPYEPLRVQMIDFGVNSGPERAVRWLQRVLGFPEERITGHFGPKTRDLLRKLGSCEAGWGYTVINDALVAARSYMIDRSVDTGAMRKADEEGVESRALSFLVSKP